ncbi:cysteine desulfurase family protein [Candidatus Nitrososphaera evergladensis SR1]|jgi:cysteine desulfurase|uniref:cysteine desulfurase n=1 Tax=Candidatus Nitrososphaera evergladensis SR1 TaxID=1459636 RepID=A0A075MZZ8_9ARCH|nr:cysteine desulfurase family protein [Candidatus Nitrososphaera evergladensis]AIF84819.1 cysteine desulfurase family protein [Candidatus Nitrososphaera evergladensis SR1]
MERIYLDSAASTPVADEVIQEMIPYLKQQFGNPSSIHYFGRETTRAIQLARKRVADLVSAKPQEITFTSGGTEADNLAVKGTADYAKSKDPSKNHIITSYIEHDAVLEPCRDLERLGYNVTFLPVTPEGLVRPEVLKEAITPSTALVSIMHANNEVGTIQPIKELAKIAHDAGALFHTDAVQAAGKIPVDVKDLGVDLLSMSSHKINGPKGVGALYIRDGLEIMPIIHGGGQESAMRSGTENVPGIVGFGKACELAKGRLAEYQRQVSALRDCLIENVLSEIPHSRLNGSRTSRLAANAHFTFFGVNGEDLIIKLDEEGIAASTGSACSVKKQKPSHVLKAMGFSYEEITGSLRISLSMQNTKEEMDRTVSALAGVVKELRSLSPFKSKYA